MSLFGQVWLWSAAAFVVGVLLTWLFLARPAQARSRHLERRLLDAQNARAAQPARAVDRDPVSAPAARKKPVGAEEPAPEEPHHPRTSWLERDSLAGRPGYQPGSEIDDDSLFDPEPRVDATTVFDAFGRDDESARRGARFAGGHEQAGEPRDETAERGALFEQGREAADQGLGGSLFDRPAGFEAASGQPGAERGHGSLFERDQAEAAQPRRGAHARPDTEPDAAARSEDGSGPLFDREDTREAGRWGDRDEAADAGSLFQPDEAAEPAAGSLFEPGGAHEPGTGRGALFGRDEAPEPEPGSLFDPGHTPEPSREAEPGAFTPFAAPEPARGQESGFTPFAAPEPPAYAFGGDEPERPADEETATETTQVLPRRQPRRPAHTVEPPRPSMRTVERREPVQPEEGGRSGSLFEPTPRAAGAPAVRARSHGDTAGSTVPPGPFGPGSAMPRPGGGKPSEEYTVKASVTALRYCTEESPQFGRMVAEVWFRSAEDAERVGFRPL
ncbi:sunset domain-containing protein [Amycolatopsis viridis]|uniref:Membrane protein ArfC n=1 Tax=Amycolatopsis viridis TaxID=185678 RepID=A0ABX0T5G6_9PSEU|nr:hypothetical protein [Amycolatopsis viridis]NIH82820.1 hypothetical protein [Amycolatopsis viridis]